MDITSSSYTSFLVCVLCSNLGSCQPLAHMMEKNMILKNDLKLKKVQCITEYKEYFAREININVIYNCLPPKKKRKFSHQLHLGMEVFLPRCSRKIIIKKNLKITLSSFIIISIIKTTKNLRQYHTFSTPLVLDHHQFSRP